jgi:hypothetical protein
MKNRKMEADYSGGQFLHEAEHNIQRVSNESARSGGRVGRSTYEAGLTHNA